MTGPPGRTSGLRVVSPGRGRVRGDGVELEFGFWPGRRRPIVAIHGITASHVQFVGVAERLAGRRPLLGLDLRGRGDSDKPTAPYGMEQHARDVAAAMRAFGLGPSIVVGHSMGAYVAAALAANEPACVAGLVLFDGGLPPPLPAGVPAAELIDRLIAPAMGRLQATFTSYAAYLDYWRAQPTFGPDEWGPWTEAYLAYDLIGEPPRLRAKPLEAAVRADWADMLDRTAAEARLGTVRAPVLVLRAEYGMQRGQPPVVPEAVLDTLRSLQPELELHTLAGTTHYTCVLADPGASRAADLLVDFAEKCGA